MYLVKSRITATLQDWPARLVPAPRGSTGAPNFLHAAIAAFTSPASRGTTRPMGNLPVVRGVRGIKRSAPHVEANFAPHHTTQFALEFSRLRK